MIVGRCRSVWTGQCLPQGSSEQEMMSPVVLCCRGGGGGGDHPVVQNVHHLLNACHNVTEIDNI